MTKPLKWSIDWEHLTLKQRFLMGAPFVATEDSVERDIFRQLNGRTEADLSAWDSYPSEIRLLATRVANALKREAVWPSALFLPEDPADIPLGGHFDQTDKWDMLPVAASIVEKESGIKMDSAFWNSLPQMTYAQAIEVIARNQAEPVHAGDSQPARRAPVKRVVRPAD